MSRKRHTPKHFIQIADNYSLVFIIFIIFFGQLKDWVGQVLFLVSCPKGQVKQIFNVEGWTDLQSDWILHPTLINYPSDLCQTIPK
jgi:hypothetical protein